MTRNIKIMIVVCICSFGLYEIIGALRLFVNQAVENRAVEKGYVSTPVGGEAKPQSGHWRVSINGTKLRWSLLKRRDASKEDVYLVNLGSHAILALTPVPNNPALSDEAMYSRHTGVFHKEGKRITEDLAVPSALKGKFFELTGGKKFQIMGFYRSKNELVIANFVCDGAFAGPAHAQLETLKEDVLRIANSFTFL